MLRIRLLVAALAALVLSVAMAQPVGATSVSDPAGVADDELISALADADLLDAWFDATDRTPTTALLLVSGSSSYDATRQDLLGRLEALGAKTGVLGRRQAQVADVEEEASTIAQMLSALRRDLLVDTQGRSTLSSVDAHEARRTLAALDPPRRFSSLSLHPADLADYQLSRVRTQLERDLDHLTRDTVASLGRQPFEASSRLAHLSLELAEVDALVALARAADKAALSDLSVERELLVPMMDQLHDLRATASTPLGGLSVVTLDAYMRGAIADGDKCAIDWTLLAGIGRVESRHGTLDDASVLGSGNLTKSIYGPLLDGGATAAEARAAAAEAEAEAIRIAEEEALAEATAAERAAEIFDVELWGERTLDKVAEQARESAEAASGEPVGRAAPPPVVEEPEPKPRFDPLLWGDVLPFTDDEDVEADDEGDGDDDEGEDEDEFAPRGNGFAVIADSDDGVLDGNARWDRAVGPMQFIPETWSYWETDGNGDGRSNPQNLYDAAAAAGRFLCDLQQRRGWSPSSFVLGNNSSDTYVRNVVAVADAFAAVELPTVDREH